mmetsp:Transcript_1900/g.4275  ORF Transcript_1900/g.4275 Transcript_1900/m.4275 type:complete len:458 (+) Transcript_1900:53-1426(+)
MPILLTALAAAGGPILKVLFISAVGYMAASDRVGLLKPSQLSSFSKMTTIIFLPPFLFIKLSNNVDMGRVFEWWTIPCFVALNILFGILFGRALIHFWGHRMGGNKGVVLASCAIGNVGQLPLALAAAACNDGLPKFDKRDGDCDEDAIAMVCFGLWIASVTMWTLGGYLINSFDGTPGSDTCQLAYAEMEENSDADALKTQLPGPAESNVETTPSAGPQVPNRTEDAVSSEAQRGHTASGKESSSAATRTEASSTPEDKLPQQQSMTQGESVVSRVLGKILARLSRVQPPIVAVVLGLLFGTHPPLNALLVQDNAPLALLKQAAEQVGGAAIPCMLMVLGANMRPKPVTGDQTDRTGGLKDVGGWPVVIAVLLIRLLLLPVVGVLLVRAATVLELIPSDPLVAFIILLQFSVPTAMNLQLVATIHGKGQAAATTLTVGQYFVAVPSLTLAMMYYLT